MPPRQQIRQNDLLYNDNRYLKKTGTHQLVDSDTGFTGPFAHGVTPPFIPYASTSTGLGTSNAYFDSTNSRIGIGTSSPNRKLESSIEDGVTNAVTYTLRLSHFTSGDADSGIGSGLELVSEDLYGTVNILATVEAIESAAGSGHPKGNLIFKTYNEAGDGLAERVRIGYDGSVLLANVKAGSTQINAGAAANEIWRTSGHATLPDNVLMIGV